MIAKSNRLLFGIAAGLCLLLALAWARERNHRRAAQAAIASLQDQLAGHQQQLEQLEQVKAENRRLATVKIQAQELDQLRQEHVELLRLRNEAAQTRQSQAAQSTGSAVRPSEAPGAASTWSVGGFSPGAEGVEAAVDPQREPVFQRMLASPANRISWSPGQAAGAPDTHQAGDISTAWASQRPDSGPEWLKLEYEHPVELSKVRIRETYNPGAVSAITATLENGSEVTIWQGEEPKADAPVEMEYHAPAGVTARKVTVHLDTARVPGWNEIDAVEVVGRDGSRQWARTAVASSYYGESRARDYRLLDAPRER